MPPKEQTKKPAAKKETSKPKPKQQKRGLKEDSDDDLLLAQASKAAAEEAKKLAEQKKIADAAKAKEKAAEDAKAREAARINKAAMAKLPPVYLEEASKKVFEVVNGEAGTMRDMPWLSYILNNFMRYVIESKRKLVLRSPSTNNVEQLVTEFEVHDLDDEEGSPHSWNVMRTVPMSNRKGEVSTYCIDLACKQFLPSGRYGYVRDTLKEEGHVPILAPSRLIKRSEEEVATAKRIQQAKHADPNNAEGEAEEVKPSPGTHVGVVATDGGILPEGGTTVVADGVPAGSRAAYMTYLGNAAAGRFNSTVGHGAHKTVRMTESEEKTARILHKQKVAERYAAIQKELERIYLEEPFNAAVAAEAVAAAGTKKEAAATEAQ